MANMWLLARLYNSFFRLLKQNVKFTDMFSRAHFQTLDSAIHETTVSDSKELLSGTKTALSSLIESACRYANALLFVRDEDGAARVSKFQTIFKANYNELFGDAKNHQNHRRQVVSDGQLLCQPTTTYFVWSNTLFAIYVKLSTTNIQCGRPVGLPNCKTSPYVQWPKTLQASTHTALRQTWCRKWRADHWQASWEPDTRLLCKQTYIHCQ